jgi:hypothetical protein
MNNRIDNHSATRSRPVRGRLLTLLLASLAVSPAWARDLHFTTLYEDPYEQLPTLSGPVADGRYCSHTTVTWKDFPATGGTTDPRAINPQPEPPGIARRRPPVSPALPAVQQPAGATLATPQTGTPAGRVQNAPGLPDTPRGGM